MGNEYDIGRRGDAPRNVSAGWDSSAYSRGLAQRNREMTQMPAAAPTPSYGASEPAAPGSFGTLALLGVGYLYAWPYFYASGFSSWLGHLLVTKGGMDNPAIFVGLAQAAIVLVGSLAIAKRFPKLSFLVGAALIVTYFWK